MRVERGSAISASFSVMSSVSKDGPADASSLLLIGDVADGGISPLSPQAAPPPPSQPTRQHAAVSSPLKPAVAAHPRAAAATVAAGSKRAPAQGGDPAAAAVAVDTLSTVV